MTDKEIEIQMEKAIDKIPWEIKNKSNTFFNKKL